MLRGFELLWMTQKLQTSHPPYLFESLIQWVTTRHTVPQATLAVSGDIPDCHNPGGAWGVGGATGIRWVEARDATKHLQCTKQLLTAKNYPAQQVNSGGENPIYRRKIQT